MPAKRILLVEDDADLVPILSAVLRTEGYAVDIARTLADAHKCLGSPDYDLVIADLRLPDGNGLEIAERASTEGVKTAILSGYLHQLSPETADRYEVMVKPMRPVELIDAVQRLIGAAVK